MQGLKATFLRRAALVFLLFFIGSREKALASLLSVHNFEQQYVECQIQSFYTHLQNKELSFDVWEKGFRGYISLYKQGKLENPRYLTLVDFSQPSSEERLFVIDLVQQTISFQSLVSHGRNSGGLMATSFSNRNSSYQSSLGFYVTAETYSGKFDYAMRLDGLEYSNSNARERAIVVHGADYATPEFLKKNNGILGRSLGCPAVPKESAHHLIDLVKNGSCFFIYSENREYARLSRLLRFIPGVDDLAQLECLREQYS